MKVKALTIRGFVTMHDFYCTWKRMDAFLAFQLAAEKSLRSWSTRRSMPVAAETSSGLGGAHEPMLPLGFRMVVVVVCFFSGVGGTVSGFACNVKDVNTVEPACKVSVLSNEN